MSSFMQAILIGMVPLFMVPLVGYIKKRGNRMTLLKKHQYDLNNMKMEALKGFLPTYQEIIRRINYIEKVLDDTRVLSGEGYKENIRRIVILLMDLVALYEKAESGLSVIHQKKIVEIRSMINYITSLMHLYDGVSDYQSSWVESIVDSESDEWRNHLRRSIFLHSFWSPESMMEDSIDLDIYRGSNGMEEEPDISLYSSSILGKVYDELSTEEKIWLTFRLKEDYISHGLALRFTLIDSDMSNPRAVKDKRDLVFQYWLDLWNSSNNYICELIRDNMNS